MEDNIPERPDRSLLQGVKVGTLGRQNERNISYVRGGSHLYILFVFYVSLPNEIKLLLFNIFIFD